MTPEQAAITAKNIEAAMIVAALASVKEAEIEYRTAKLAYEKAGEQLDHAYAMFRLRQDYARDIQALLNIGKEPCAK